MKDILNITVDNKLITGKRAVSVYHHATRGAHLISYNGSITLPLGRLEKEDYLHISVARGPGSLKKMCVLDLPFQLDFEFSGEGKIFINHKGNRVLIKIPPGPPVWQLKLTGPENSPPGDLSGGGNERITIGELPLPGSVLAL